MLPYINILFVLGYYTTIHSDRNFFHVMQVHYSPLTIFFKIMNKFICNHKINPLSFSKGKCKICHVAGSWHIQIFQSELWQFVFNNTFDKMYYLVFKNTLGFLAFIKHFELTSQKLHYLNLDEVLKYFFSNDFCIIISICSTVLRSF